MKSYKELLVWQKSVMLVREIYLLTASFSKDERFGLISQMRRCSVSIPSNIAEGQRRGSRKDYRNFLIMAFSSGAELETQIHISKMLSFCSRAKFTGSDKLLLEIMKMLNKMITSLGTTTYNLQTKT